MLLLVSNIPIDTHLSEQKPPSFWWFLSSSMSSWTLSPIILIHYGSLHSSYHDLFVVLHTHWLFAYLKGFALTIPIAYNDLQLDIYRDHSPLKGLCLNADYNSFYANYFFGNVILGSRSEGQGKHNREGGRANIRMELWATVFSILYDIWENFQCVHQHTTNSKF